MHFIFYTVTFIIEGDNILGVRHEQYILFRFPHSISIIYFCGTKNDISPLRVLKYVSINIRPNIGILEGQSHLVVLVVDDQALQIYSYTSGTN